MAREKVLLLTNIIAPYRVPVFNEIAKNANFDFLVLFMQKLEPDRKWEIDLHKIKFDYKILPGIHLSISKNRFIHANFSIIPELTVKSKYDLIAIGGYAQLTDWMAFIISKLKKKKVIYFGESTKYEIRQDSFIVNQLKRFFIKNFDAYLPAGKAAAEYVKSLGAPDNKIYIAPFNTDYEFFEKAHQNLKDKRNLLKKEFGPNLLILYNGRLVWYKGVGYLLRAYKKLSIEFNNDIGLLIVGDGPQREELEKYVKREKLPNVFFVGHKKYGELPYYYIISDILVLPSLSEPWGLVINEAMIFGLPVITTTSVGASYDLIKDGVNGFIIKPGSEEELYSAIKKLIENQTLRKKMGVKSREIIINYNNQKNWAQVFIDTVNKLLNLK